MSCSGVECWSKSSASRFWSIVFHPTTIRRSERASLCVTRFRDASGKRNVTFTNRLQGQQLERKRTCGGRKIHLSSGADLMLEL